MRFNPFEEKPMPLDQLFMDWDKLYPKPRIMIFDANWL